jgi:hypothetical protein
MLFLTEPLRPNRDGHKPALSTLSGPTATVVALYAERTAPAWQDTAWSERPFASAAVGFSVCDRLVDAPQVVEKGDHYVHEVAASVQAVAHAWQARPRRQPLRL